MIFEGFEGPFSQPKSIKPRFRIDLAMKCTPRRPQDVPKTSQDGPKTSPRRPKTPKTAPRRPQDGPKTAPRRAQDAPRTPQDAPQGAGTVAGTPPPRPYSFSLLLLPLIAANTIKKQQVKLLRIPLQVRYFHKFLLMGPQK